MPSDEHKVLELPALVNIDMANTHLLEISYSILVLL